MPTNIAFLAELGDRVGPYVVSSISRTYDRNLYVLVAPDKSSYTISESEMKSLLMGDPAIPLTQAAILKKLQRLSSRSDELSV